MGGHRFLVIDRRSDELAELSRDETLERLGGIGGPELVMGYDCHAGFNFPAAVELDELIRGLGKNVALDLSVIDERRQSNDRPYSPTSIQVQSNGRILRRNIHPRRHSYVSQIRLDKEKVIEIYKELLGDKFADYAGILEATKGKMLGDFIANLTKKILEEMLKENRLMRFRHVFFDRFDDENGSVAHPLGRHVDHDVLYISQHKAILNRKACDYLVSKFKPMGAKPYLIIIPINPEPYFRA